MTRQRSKRIFGMTVAQLFILLCLGCSMIGVLGAGLWVAASGMGVTLSPWPTRIVPPTTAPILTATPLPTLTPSPEPTLTPTVTPIPYEAYIPADWRQYKTGSMEIWLPENFNHVNDPEAFQQEFTELYERIGLGEFAEPHLKDILVHELLFRYGLPTSNQYIPTVFIKQSSRNGLSLPQFVDKTISALGPSYSLVEREPFDFYERQGERVIVQANYNTVYLSFVYYLVRDGDTIWEIGGDAHLDDFYNLLPVYDNIAHSFRTVE
jgi:hypothetical protein